MELSHFAPLRMAPRCVRKKYWPESNELRHGVQLGAVTNALRNSTPSPAMRSMFGVRMTSLIPGRPSTFA
jgi:hypothetical protein